MSTKHGKNAPCWCSSGRKYKNCHSIADEKTEYFRRKDYIVPDRELLKTEPQIQGIRDSSRLNIALLDYIEEHVVDGVSSEDLDILIEQKTREMGGVPATLNYNGYPKSCCVSINEVVCHGIPSSRMILKKGDIVNIDVSTIYRGYFSDSSRMFCIGEISDEKRRLVETAKECMDIGIEQVKPWGFLGDIGQAVGGHAKQNGYTVVREIGGHGIGLQFHEEPWVGYVAKRGTGMLLVPGMVFTIEPMINMGKAKVVTDADDEWTVYTADNMPSAQWESTVLVTSTGCEILTY